MKKKKLCELCGGKNWKRYQAAVGNPYSYNYELRQDYKTQYEPCRECNRSGKKPNRWLQR